MNQRKKYTYFILFLVWLTCTFVITGCQDKGKGTAEKNATAAAKFPAASEEPVNENYDTKITAVVKNIQPDLNEIQVYDIAGKKDYILDFTGAADMKDQYGQLITAAQITVGEIVDVYFYNKTGKLMSLNVSEKAWTYAGISNLKADKTNYRMKITGRNYWYEDDLLIFSEAQLIDLIDIHTKDLLTVKGIDSQICSISVEKGHGYLRLTNYTDFVGGTIEVGYGIIKPVVEDMLIVAREGDYKVVLENGKLTGEKNITIKQNEDVVLDWSEYRMEKEEIASVRFNIEPFGADLYINDSLVDYTEFVKLNYGKHKVRLEMNGYDEFNGNLKIAEPHPIIDINLVEGTFEVETPPKDNLDAETGTTEPPKSEIEEELEEADDEEDTTEEGALPDEEEQEQEGTTAIDEEHSITIEAPAGSTLYLNGKRMGVLPLTFTKEIGDHTIVLSQTGYLTKSYSVEVIDDGENALFNFPDMISSE